MDDSQLSTCITLTAAAAFLISGWALACVTLARRSGWMRLARAYRHRGRVYSTAHRFKTVRFEPTTTWYPAGVTLRYAVEGMAVAASPLFRPGHPPLLIPWDQMEIYLVDHEQAKKTYDLCFAQVPGVRVRVSVKIAQQIRRAADNAQYFLEPAGLAATKSGDVKSPLRDTATAGSPVPGR